VILWLFLSSLSSTYGQSDINTKVNQYEKGETSNKSMIMDTFLTIPDEIEGCSCYFSNDPSDFEARKYIYVNDFAQTAFVSINGEMIKFTQVELQQIDKDNTTARYKSTNYEMTIQVKDGGKISYETSIKTGLIKLTNKAGISITKKFYGACGC
jgi:hypothetical protein